MGNSQSTTRPPSDQQPTDERPDGEAARRSAASTFADHYRCAYSQVWLVAAGMIGDRSYADDLVQEASVIAWKKWDQFETGTNFTAWLSEIVRRCALNYSRKVRGRRTIPADPHLIDATEEVAITASRHGTVELGTGVLSENQRDFDDQVLAALNALGGEARCCLLLRIVHQLSYKEIAELMEMPAGTAMSHVHRAKKTMRIHLQQVAKTSIKSSEPKS